MLHFLPLVNYERKIKKDNTNYQKKFKELRKASIITLLAINYFIKNSNKFIGKSSGISPTLKLMNDISLGIG